MYGLRTGSVMDIVGCAKASGRDLCGHPCGLHAVSHVRKDLSRCLAVLNFHERPSCHSWVAPGCPQAPGMIELHSVHQWDSLGCRPRPPGPQTCLPLHTCSASILDGVGRFSNLPFDVVVYGGQLKTRYKQVLFTNYALRHNKLQQKPNHPLLGCMS